MAIKINTNISNEFDEESITINAPKLTDEIQNIIKYIYNTSVMPTQIVANKDNKIYFIDLKNVICFFSKDKNNYVRIEDGIYKVKYKLYELEELLVDRDFIRISNSCIINIKQVECFDTSILGTVIVKFKDNTQEIVSKRKFAQLKKLLDERGNLK